jgi:hypothetical protein
MIKTIIMNARTCRFNRRTIFKSSAEGGFRNFSFLIPNFYQSRRSRTAAPYF